MCSFEAVTLLADISWSAMRGDRVRCNCVLHDPLKVTGRSDEQSLSNDGRTWGGFVIRD